MAAVFLVRVAVAAAGIGYRVLRIVEGPGLDKVSRVSDWLLDQLATSAESDESLSATASEHIGYSATVSTLNEPFELRRVQINFTQADQAVTADDVRVCTLDLFRAADPPAAPVWDANDFLNLESGLTNLWATLDNFYTANTKLHKISVYKIGPDITPPQPPVFEKTLNWPGIGTGSVLPPQCAISVTEKAGSKPHWGRMYLPAMVVSTASVYGRFTESLTVVTAFDAFYSGLKNTYGLHPMVYRRALPARERKDGVVLPARPASAWSVDDLQVDDVFDVMRSRRWKYPTLRSQAAVT